MTLGKSRIFLTAQSLGLVVFVNYFRRLYPDMSFFQLPTPYPRANFSAGQTNKNAQLDMIIHSLKTRPRSIV